MTSLNPALKSRLESLIQSDRVVVFMKGNRTMPRCGFSAAVVEMLDSLLPSYTTVDVLADPDVREGIKVFSDWPTIPQLYIDGEFQGGSDIAREMFDSFELHKKLGVTPPKAGEAVAVDVAITAAAAAALRDAQQGEPEGARFLRLGVTRNFKHQLGFGPALPGDGVAHSEGIDIRVDAASLPRAGGVRIDFVTTPQGSGFRIDNPNEPARVKQVSVQELKAVLDAGGDVHLYDVRTPAERETASIKQARAFDPSVVAALDKNTPVYLHCHHGGRSQAAAEQLLAQGFRNVFNVAGGIDAWSQQIDSSVPRY